MDTAKAKASASDIDLQEEVVEGKKQDTPPPVSPEDDPEKTASATATENNNLVNVNPEEFSQAIQELEKKIPYFQANPMGDLKLVYQAMPCAMDWDNGQQPFLDQCFPPMHKRQRAIPKCLLLEAANDIQKLVVLTWWRQFQNPRQAEIFNELKQFYRAPRRTSSPLLARHLGPSSKKKKLRKWGFLEVATGQEIAKRLDVPLGSLWCVELINNAQCAVEGCVYPPALHNRHRCCLHNRIWFPHNGGKRVRGRYFLGPSYANAPTSSREYCRCSSEDCEGIGYSPHLIPVTRHYQKQTPQNQAFLEQLLPNHSSAVRILLAPWHFHPQHRVFSAKDQTWQIPPLSLKITSTFQDPNNNGNGDPWIGMPPPTYNPKDFLQEPETQLLLNPNPVRLPSWVYVYQSKELGPRTDWQCQTTLHQHALQELQSQYQQTMDQHSTLQQQHAQLQKQHMQLQDKLQKLQTLVNINKVTKVTKVTKPNSSSLRKKKAKRKADDAEIQQAHVNGVKQSNDHDQHHQQLLLQALTTQPTFPMEQPHPIALPHHQMQHPMQYQMQQLQQAAQLQMEQQQQQQPPVQQQQYIPVRRLQTAQFLAPEHAQYYPNRNNNNNNSGNTTTHSILHNNNLQHQQQQQLPRWHGGGRHFL